METVFSGMSNSSRWMVYFPTSWQWPHSALHNDFWNRPSILMLHLGFFFFLKKFKVASVSFWLYRSRSSLSELSRSSSPEESLLLFGPRFFFLFSLLSDSS